MEQLFISYKDFDPRRLTKNVFSQKQAKIPANPTTGSIASEINYYIAPITYDYVTTDQNGNECVVKAPFAIEAPELFSPTGITTRINAGGKMTASCCHF